MAVYMLIAAVAIVWLIALYMLWIQIQEFLKVWPAWKEFNRSHPTVLKVQTNPGMIFLCLFMMVFGIILAMMEQSHSVRLCFAGISVLFSAYLLKNLMIGRLYWSADSFLWKNYARTFRSIKRFDEISRTAAEIEFTKESPLVLPAAIALQIRSLKAKQNAMRIKIKKA